MCGSSESRRYKGIHDSSTRESSEGPPWPPLHTVYSDTSRTKYCLMWMWRENFLRTGFSLIAMQAKLSSWRRFALVWEYPKLVSVSDRSLLGLLGYLRQILPRRWKGTRYLGADSTKRWGRHSSWECIPCEIVGCQYLQPNPHPTSPTKR